MDDVIGGLCPPRGVFTLARVTIETLYLGNNSVGPLLNGPLISGPILEKRHMKSKRRLA
jgi:hypothetical protein